MGSGQVLVAAGRERESMKRHAEGMLWVVSFVSLIVTAMTTTKAYLPDIAIVWVVSSVIVIPLHFYKAWRRWLGVANKRECPPRFDTR